MDTTFTATSRYDKSKHPEVKTYRYLTYAECKALQSHSDVICQGGIHDGEIAHVKITSLHTFKTRPELQIGWKFGMREYGKESISQDSDNRLFVVEIEPEPEPLENPACPGCGGVGIPMGTLGNRSWFRCEICAFEFSA